MASANEGKVVVTLKGGRDFDAPWIVIHADDVSEANDLLEQANNLELHETVAAAAAFFRGVNVAEQGGVTQGSAERQQPKATQDSGDTPPESAGRFPVKCTQHGLWREFRELKKCDAYFCAKKEKSEQCKPLFTDHGTNPVAN